jgi:Glycosyl transferase family 2
MVEANPHTLTELEANSTTTEVSRVPEIEIVVPAHNCEAWLDDLIESILLQDADNWRIVARDDASTDDTAARLAVWQQRLGERMMILPTGPNLGMIGNYDAVLAATTARWVMFADPDDVWKPKKMTSDVAAMRSAEAGAGAHTPIVVCSDAEVVDAQLHPIAASYWRWSRMKPSLCGVFHRLLVDSPVLSSTMMVNRALLKMSLPMTGAAACPDWWHALVACALGRIVCLPQATISYRRHPNNDSVVPTTASLVIGARRIGGAHNRVQRLVRQYSAQAGRFSERFESRLSSAQRRALDAARKLPSLGPLTRRWSVMRHRLWFGSSVKNAGLMLFL